MNSGYLSFILLSITLILLASGWKEIFVRSISHRSILLFFIGWLSLCRFSVTIHGKEVYLVYVWAALLSLAVLWRTAGFANKLHLLSIGLLLGSFHFLMQEVLSMDPILIMGNSKLDAALLLAACVLLLQRSDVEQIACLSIGFLMGDAYHAFIHSQMAPALYGGPDFQDQWWLAVFAARLATFVMQTTYTACRGMVKGWLERKGGWRK